MGGASLDAEGWSAIVNSLIRGRKSGSFRRLALLESRWFPTRMYTFLLVLLIIDALVLIAAILMQAAKGGGLAASFGGVSTAADSFIGTRQAGNLLTKIALVVLVVSSSASPSCCS